MEIREIRAEELDAKEFIESKVKEISDIRDLTINALSGGNGSSVVAMLLGHRALGSLFITFFIDNGLMRKGEPEKIVSSFKRLGVSVELVDAKEEFFNALRGINDPEARKETITQTFRRVFTRCISMKLATCILQGTILTDVDKTLVETERHHNILKQLDIDHPEECNYRIIEPLVQLRKPAVRKVAKALGLSIHI